MRTCHAGHPWAENRTKRGDECAICKREVMRARADRMRGGPPRKPDPQRFPCGHEREGNTRPGRSDCRICHRETQKQRYRGDPVTHRRKAREYQRANRASANARTRAFYQRNPGYSTARRYAPDEATRDWLGIIAKDPCSYCGGPSDAVDHIAPVSRGGANHWTNFAPTCRACNSSKRDRELLHWLLQFRAA